MKKLKCCVNCAAWPWIRSRAEIWWIYSRTGGFWDIIHGLDSYVSERTQLLLSKRFQNIGNLFPESGISGSDISFFTSDTAGSENKSATREEERKSLNKRKRPLLRLSSDKGHCITWINIRGSHLKLQNFSWLKSPELLRSKADKLRFKPGKSI